MSSLYMIASALRYTRGFPKSFHRWKNKFPRLEIKFSKLGNFSFLPRKQVALPEKSKRLSGEIKTLIRKSEITFLEKSNGSFLRKDRLLGWCYSMDGCLVSLKCELIHMDEVV